MIRLGQRCQATRRQQKSSARNAVIEAQRVHPAFVDQLMHGSPVIRIRTCGEIRHNIAHQPHAVEVAKDERGVGFRVGEARRDR